MASCRVNNLHAFTTCCRMEQHSLFQQKPRQETNSAAQILQKLRIGSAQIRACSSACVEEFQKKSSIAVQAYTFVSSLAAELSITQQ